MSPFQHGKFKSHPGQVSSTGSKTPPAQTGMHEKGKGPAEQAPHGGSSVEHVTKTHPGETQPHPTTGVHAFHAHHTGGGKYKSHTHHDGGDVQTQDHANHGDMQGAMQEALPSDGQDQMGDQGQDDMMGYEDALGGIGGHDGGGA